MRLLSRETATAGGSGLVYMNARYYDPQLGQFISPDTLVPQPALLVDCNRYLYSRGNPIKYNDPTGHFSEDQLSGLYGENWRELFSSEWIRLLLDNADSQTLGAQLGDLVVMGGDHNLTMGVLVLNETGDLALWDVMAKTVSTVKSLGQVTPQT